MSTKLLELEDRIITDRGETVAKFDLLIKKALSDEIFTDLPALYHEDIKFWNRKQPDDKITIWEDDGEFCGPDETTFEWNIPKKYLKLDIEELAAEKFAEMGFDGNTVYEDRLVWELGQMRKQEMYPFIRCLVYVIDEFRKHDILWGVGRGSSCSSLVMFILGINRVDPIKYNIDPKEFFK